MSEFLWLIAGFNLGFTVIPDFQHGIHDWFHIIDVLAPLIAGMLVKT